MVGAVLMVVVVGGQCHDMKPCTSSLFMDLRYSDKQSTSHLHYRVFGNIFSSICSDLLSIEMKVHILY